AAEARDGDSPLTAAASEGQLKIADLLLAHGAKVNARTRSGILPLIAAAKEYRNDMVQFLISKGADLEARDLEGCTALFYAAYNSNNEDANGASVPTVKILLAKGAKVNVKDGEGSTPLALAAKKGEAEIVQMLIAAGAEITATNQNRETVLHSAVAGGADPGLAKILVSGGAALDAQDAAGETALMKACRRKRAGMATALIGLSAKPNLQDKE